MSIVQVAKLAKVSHSTVSRVLNNRPVSEETAAQVRAAIQKLGFKPRARRPGPKPAALPSLSHGNIALLFPGLDPGIPRHNVIARLIVGIQQALEAKGLNLILGRPEDPRRMPEIIQRGRADGVLALGFPPDPQVLAQVQRIPFVWLLGNTPPGIDAILSDNIAIGNLAARYLAQQGCQRVAFVNPYMEHDECVLRGQAFCMTATSAGLDVKTVNTGVGHILGMWNPREGLAAVERAADELLQLNPRPQGIFVPMDELMAYLAAALERRGVSFGNFTAIGCNNDESWLSLLHPRPATIDPNMEACGAWAVELLLRQTFNGPLYRGVHLTLPPVLIPPSAAAPKAH